MNDRPDHCSRSGRAKRRDPASDARLDDIVAGGIGGVVATVAMTAAMEFLYRRLPKEEQYPLPPRELVDRTLPAAADEIGDIDRTLLTLLAHGAYGAATGALYAVLARKPSAASGAAYGVLVWVASYCGWIPLAGLLKPATRHPRRRNLLMIVAHLVWGGTLGATLRRSRSPGTAPGKL